MSMQNLTIKEIAEKARPILKQAGVLRSSIFGSVARGEANENSDVDILKLPSQNNKLKYSLGNGRMKVCFNKVKLEQVAKSFGLKFIILHGSFANGKPDKESDLDIAVVSKELLDFRTELELCSKFEDVFTRKPRRDLDFKTLNKVDAFFRHMVVKDGILLYGNETDFEDFKAFALRAFEDARPLLNLEHYLIQKFQTHLNAQYVK